MRRYLSGEALLIKCRAGRGKIVIVEGETDDDDPYFYGRWFGDRARELSFYPQNGWKRVREAVRELRAQPGLQRSVYGLVDRDFCDETTEDAVPEEGVFQARYYTLENYLLAPEGWFQVVRLGHRGALPPDWDAVEAVASQVDRAYEACLPLAAWNFVVHRECSRGASAVEALRFCEHAKSVPAEPEAQLTVWGDQRGAPTPLGESYRAELERLRAQPAEWPCRVTGKAVLKLLLERFPVARGPRPHADTLVNLYLQVYPRPPDELERLVERILALP